MKNRILSVFLALAMLLLTTACAKPAPQGDAPAPGNSAAPADEIIEINILWQQEITEVFMNEAIAKLEGKHPNVKVNLEISPQAYSEITNRLASGKAPDIFFSWHSDVDYYAMMKEGLLNPVDSFLELDTIEEGGKLSDRINKLGVSQGEYDGSHYMLPITQFLAANFYNKAAFADMGVEPKLDNIADFKETCAKIKATGKADPIIYAGAYPFMVVDAMLYPMIYTKDPQAVADINAGKAGAWSAPAVVECVKEWESLIKEGYVTKNSLAMDHIQSQIEFINNRAAVVPVGTWLEGEMTDQWPDGFELTPFFAPSMGSAKPATVAIMEYMIFPKQADDTKLPYVGELVREFYSEANALRCLKETGAVMALDKLSDDMNALLPASVSATYKLVENADTCVPAYKITNKALLTECNNAINALTAGDMTAEEFCAAMDMAQGA